MISSVELRSVVGAQRTDFLLFVHALAAGAIILFNASLVVNGCFCLYLYQSARRGFTTSLYVTVISNLLRNRGCRINHLNILPFPNTTPSLMKSAGIFEVAFKEIHYSINA